MALVFEESWSSLKNKLNFTIMFIFNSIFHAYFYFSLIFYWKLSHDQITSPMNIHPIWSCRTVLSHINQISHGVYVSQWRRKEKVNKNYLSRVYISILLMQATLFYRTILCLFSLKKPQHTYQLEGARVDIAPKSARTLITKQLLEITGGTHHYSFWVMSILIQFLKVL